MSDLAKLAGNSALSGVPIEMRICVGRARPTLSELLNLERDAVLPLDARLEDRVEIMIGDRVIARGDLVELDGDRAGQLAVSITDITDGGDGA